MMLINDQISNSQLKQIDELTELCRSVDPGVPNVYRNLMIEPRSRDCNILYYNQGKLVGFLSAYYFFYDACELTIMVHPEYRRKGIARLMLKRMHSVFKERFLIRVVFSRFPDEHDIWLRELGLTYHHSEYSMSVTPLVPYEIKQGDLVISKATADDIEIMQDLDSRCFPNVNNKVPTDFFQVFHDPEYTIYMAKLNNIPIGKAHIKWDSDFGFLSDIAVYPEYQGRGFGSSIMQYCANKILLSGRNKVMLDIISKNTGALRIYIKNGFKVINQRDYWEFLIDGLTKFVL